MRVRPRDGGGFGWAPARVRLRFADSLEVSLEANPGTIERDSFTAYAQAGVNRVSLGVQSFDDRLLGTLGRIHDRSSIHDALGSLARSSITNFNLDLSLYKSTTTMIRFGFTVGSTGVFKMSGWNLDDVVVRRCQ